MTFLPAPYLDRGVYYVSEIIGPSAYLAPPIIWHSRVGAFGHYVIQFMTSPIYRATIYVTFVVLQVPGVHQYHRYSLYETTTLRIPIHGYMGQRLLIFISIQVFCLSTDNILQGWNLLTKLNGFDEIGPML